MRELPPGNAAGTLYFLHSDHLGSTSAVTNLSGSVVARQWYDPYGAVRASTGTLPTKRTYTGQIADDTGLMFYNARYYAPLMGRFASADPLPPVPGGCPPTGGTGGAGAGQPAGAEPVCVCLQQPAQVHRSERA
jgi:hypothetical protein